MNLADLDTTSLANQGAVLELRGIDGAPLRQADGSPITLTLLGADSDVAVKARNAATNRRIQQGPRLKITAEALDAEAVAYLAKLTVAWSGVGIDEDETPCTPENAARLYERFRFIREQAETFIEDRANFTRA